MKVRDNIYRTIVNKNYKQLSIARACGFDLKVFNNMVKGRRRIYADDIPKICSAIQVTPNDLFDKVGDGE